ncbi:MAG: hypothetical protein HY719_13035, partial [Planctomycetes bacterium]|nr:hypothetical protein [Planctomycetota bacterium]
MTANANNASNGARTGAPATGAGQRWSIWALGVRAALASAALALAWATAACDGGLTVLPAPVAVAAPQSPAAPALPETPAAPVAAGGAAT